MGDDSPPTRAPTQTEILEFVKKWVPAIAGIFIVVATALSYLNAKADKEQVAAIDALVRTAQGDIRALQAKVDGLTSSVNDRIKDLKDYMARSSSATATNVNRAQ